MRALALVSLLIATLVSGCVDEDAPEADETVAGEEPVTADPVAVTNPYHGWGPRFVAEPLYWNGTLGTYAFACEYQTTGACPGHIVESGNNNFYIEGPFLLGAADITLTWNAGNPLLKELHFEIMTMGHDAGNQELESIVGASPLNIKIDGLGLNLTENDSIHIFAYNPKGIVHHAPFVAHASLWQDFSVTGTLTRAESVVAVAAEP